MRFFVSTENVREDEQFAYWREILCQAAMCLTPERDVPGPFAAWKRGRAFGGATISEGSAPRHSLTRTRGDLARMGVADYIVAVRLAADARYVVGDREFLVREGEVLVADLASFKLSDYGTAMRCGTIRLPRHLLEPRLATVDGARAIHISRGESLGQLICDYARHLVAGACGAEFDSLTAADEADIVRHLCGLLSLALGPSSDGRDVARDSLGAARLDAIERYLEANYADPAVSPETVSARFGISLRYMHKLFERSGRSFMETLVQRRLAACAAMLSVRDAGDRRPIAEIARRAGFASLTQFNRQFRGRYGVTPRAWRATRR